MRKTKENKGDIDPKKLSNMELIIYHRQIHIMWRAMLEGADVGIEKDQIFNHHEIAAKEMTKRKIQIDSDGNHTTPLPTTPEEPIPVNNEATSTKYLRHYPGHVDRKKKKPELSKEQIADIKTLIKGTQSLSDIARMVGCSKSSVVYHAKKKD